MKKRVFSLLVSLAVVLSFAVPAFAAEFTDVPAGSWYASGVSAVADGGIMTGTGNGRFSPSQTVSWAQAVTIAARLHAQNAGGSIAEAQEGESWYDPALSYAVDHKLLPSTCPEGAALLNPLTRKELAYLLAQTGFSLGDVNNGALADVSSLSEEFTAAIETVAHGGVMSGKEGGKFDPEGRATRAELAVTVARLLNPALRTTYDSRQNLSDDTLGNFVTGGVADEAADGYTYCTVDRNGTADVLRIDKNGKAQVLWTTSEYEPYQVALFDGYVYMRARHFGEGSAYYECVMRLPKEGGEPETLYTGKYGLELYTIYDGKLYVLEQVSQPVKPDSWQYRISRIENGKATPLGKPLSFGEMIYTDELYGFGGKLYFVRYENSSSGVYAIDLETGTQSIVYDGNIEEIVFLDNSCYFIPWDNHDYGTKFYRLRLAGGEPEFLFEIPQAKQSIALRHYRGTFYLLGKNTCNVWSFGLDGVLKPFIKTETPYFETLSFINGNMIVSTWSPQWTSPEDTYFYPLTSNPPKSAFVEWIDAALAK